MRTLHNQTGFYVLEVLILFGVLGFVGAIGWRIYTQVPHTEAKSLPINTTAATQMTASFDSSIYTTNIWERSDDQTWSATNNPPECPSPLSITMPFDSSKATAVLLPGQKRMSPETIINYPYASAGGLRFDTSVPGDIKVQAPFDGYITQSDHYLANGEVQYKLEIIHPCGLMARFDHLRNLTTELEDIVDQLPPHKSASPDFRGPQLNKLVKSGAQIATAAGQEISDDMYVEFGLYDLRTVNTAAQTPSFKHTYQRGGSLIWHGLCWLDYIPESDQVELVKLPSGDLSNQFNSDYCNWPR